MKDKYERNVSARYVLKHTGCLVACIAMIQQRRFTKSNIHTRSHEAKARRLIRICRAYLDKVEAWVNLESHIEIRNRDRKREL